MEKKHWFCRFFPFLTRTFFHRCEVGSKLHCTWTPSRSIWGTVTRHKGSQNVLWDISLRIMGLLVLGVKSISATGQFRYLQPTKRVWFHAEDMGTLDKCKHNFFELSSSLCWLSLSLYCWIRLKLTHWVAFSLCNKVWNALSKLRCRTSRKNGGPLWCQTPRSSTGYPATKVLMTRRGAWSLIRVWSNTGASTPFLTAMPGFHRKRNKEDWDGWTVDGPFLGGVRLPVRWPVSVMRSKTGTTEFTWCYTYIDISFMEV